MNISIQKLRHPIRSIKESLENGLARKRKAKENLVFAENINNSLAQEMNALRQSQNLKGLVELIDRVSEAYNSRHLDTNFAGQISRDSLIYEICKHIYEVSVETNSTDGLSKVLLCLARIHDYEFGTLTLIINDKDEGIIDTKLLESLIKERL